jgi:hypothetical protein
LNAGHPLGDGNFGLIRNFLGLRKINLFPVNPGICRIGNHSKIAGQSLFDPKIWGEDFPC